MKCYLTKTSNIVYRGKQQTRNNTTSLLELEGLPQRNGLCHLFWRSHFPPLHPPQNKSNQCCTTKIGSWCECLCGISLVCLLGQTEMAVAGLFHQYVGSVQHHGCVYDSGFPKMLGTTSLRFVSKDSTVEVGLCSRKRRRSSGMRRIHLVGASTSAVSTTQSSQKRSSEFVNVQSLDFFFLRLLYPTFLELPISYL